jgi:hypothetical protein
MSAGRTAPADAGAVTFCMATRNWLKVSAVTAALGTGLLLFLAGGTAVFACCAYNTVSAFCNDRTLARTLFYTGWRIDGLCQAPDRSPDGLGAR